MDPVGPEFHRNSMFGFMSPESYRHCVNPPWIDIWMNWWMSSNQSEMSLSGIRSFIVDTWTQFHTGNVSPYFYYLSNTTANQGLQIQSSEPVFMICSDSTVSSIHWTTVLVNFHTSVSCKPQDSDLIRQPAFWASPQLALLCRSASRIWRLSLLGPLTKPGFFPFQPSVFGI